MEGPDISSTALEEILNFVILRIRVNGTWQELLRIRRRGTIEDVCLRYYQIHDF